MLFSHGHSFHLCYFGIFSMIKLLMDICLTKVLFIKQALLGFSVQGSGGCGSEAHMQKGMRISSSCLGLNL